MPSHPQVPSRIANWILEERLGAGYSGSIWRAVNPYTGQIAALKLQDVNHECPTNRYERYFYPALQGGIGMPTLWAAGVEGKFDYLVIDLLGTSLESLYRQNDRIFDLRSTLCIAMQVISRLEFMHYRGILHRDIQLGNCVIGLPPNEKTIYMIDFGFSKRYIDPETRCHIPNSRAKRDFIGNYWFSSVNVHCKGKVPSRRDDLEALALMLIHVLTPAGLPWTRNGIPKDDDEHDRLVEEKLLARPDDLCRGLPSVFEEFLRYCRRLKFFDQPNYAYWHAMFAEVAREHGFLGKDGRVSDAFHWPPRPCVLHLHENTTKIAGKHTAQDLEIDKLLGDLAQLNLGENVNERPSTKKPPPDTEKPQKATKSSQAYEDVTVISSDESSAPTSTSLKRGSQGDRGRQQFDRYSKAAAIKQLAGQARATVTNKELADVLHTFVELFHANRSKVVTKDAFEFLVALGGQLEDPSIFIAQPEQHSENAQTSEKSRTQTKQGGTTGRGGATVKMLYQRLVTDQAWLSNSRLAVMVVDFSNAIRATSGKTLSKIGFAFLEEIETRLRQS